MKTLAEFDRATLEDGRAALIRFISDRRPHGSGCNSITVVFDGKEDVYFSGNQAWTGVGVFFTKGISADDHIRVSVEEAADPRSIICVTDDRELALACRHRGATTWSVAQFAARGHREENSPARHAARTRAGEDGKHISSVVAQRIDQELLALWSRKKR